MGERFDPSAWLERVFPKGIEKTGLLTDGLDIKKRYLKALVRATGQSGRKITAEVYKTVEFYAEKEAALKAAGERAFKQEALNGQALLTSRLKNFLVYSEVQEQRKRHKGKLYRWLPSSAENPDPEHQLLYGKVRREGEGEMPGERWGCQCGIEWLDDEDMTPDEKIETLKVDFTRDSFFPALNDEQLNTMGKKSKPVVLRERTSKRNLSVHAEINKKEYADLIGQALYKPLVRPLQDTKNKNYWHFIGVSAEDRRAIVLLDMEEQKEAFEVVHILKMRRKSARALLRKLGFTQ
ncbi:MAG: hypothetical protein PUC11_06835 [Elusimicrobia bacterium]|nr:hypothetical protein [Elusimicrobiota bacterium]